MPTRPARSFSWTCGGWQVADSPTQHFTLSDGHRRAITGLDERLGEEIPAIEDAVAMHLGMMPRETFNQMLARAEIMDWRGRPITTAGGKRAYADVAKAARDLLAALDNLNPLRKLELGDILASYADHPDVANRADLDFPPRLAPFAVLTARLANEAQKLVPSRGRGNPRRHQRLVSNLTMIAHRSGANVDWERPAQPSGIMCGLVAICLEAAGETVSDTGRIAEIVRRSLDYEDRDDGEAWRHAERWELHCAQKCDPRTCEFCA